MQTMYYIGVDVHKRTISYCVKDGSGVVHTDGTIPATRLNLDLWCAGRKPKVLWCASASRIRC